MAKTEEETETTKKEEVKPKAEKVIQHGIARPNPGSKTARVFDIADELSKAAGAPPARKKVLMKAESEGINITTAATQYGRWRKFNGLAKERTEEEKEN